jgi:threonine dehydratase
VSEKNLQLVDVLAAQRRISPYVNKTPLVKSHWLSSLTQSEVLLKLENVQVTGSFKYRGATNSLIWAKEQHITKIFSATAGNHGLGLAEASIHVESDVTICLPVTASPLKKQKLKTYSVSVIEHGEDFDVCEAYAKRMATQKNAFFLSAYNHPEVIAGNGTVALEMLEEVPQLTTLIIACGGGGLIGGMAVAAKAINPSIKIIGVVAANSPAMLASINAGRIVRAFCDKTIADGIWGNLAEDAITFPLAKELVDDWISIEESEIKSTIFEYLDNEGMLIEGAAAVAVAALSRKYHKPKSNDRVGVVVCGGNIAKQDWREILVEHLVGAGKA